MAPRPSLVSLSVAILISWIAVPATVCGYGGLTHEYLDEEAAKVFDFPALTDPVLGHLPTVKAESEDHEDHVYGHDTIPTCSHFWDADNSDLHETSIDGCANAYMKADELFDQLFQFMWEYDADPIGHASSLTDAYDRLGHVTHLIADMTVPAHAHRDPHSSFDSYDDGWSGWRGENEDQPANHELFTFGMANADGGLIDPPQSAIDEIIGHPEAGYDLTPDPVAKAKFFYLMYTANQTGDYFPSDDYDGDADDRLGWMNGYSAPPVPGRVLHTEDGSLVLHSLDGLDDNWWYQADEAAWYFSDHDGDLSTIGRVEMVYALRAIAGMYKVFRDTFDAVPPVTTSTVTYEYPPNQGWTRGWVEISLSATDNYSGLHRTLWGLDAGAELYEYTAERIRSYDELWPPTFIEVEGVHHFWYFSNDWFGNAEENQKMTIQVDRTKPVIHSTTPAAAGFYLTSDHLTIGWNVTDALSGVDSVVATLDGVPVHQGDVLNLAAMGGFHTFALTARDIAGNEETTTFQFSVKISATIAFKPDSVNVKSGGQSVASFTEFPAGYDVAKINSQTAQLVFKNWMIQAEASPSALSDFDKDGIVDRMIQFPRSSLVYAVTYSPPAEGFTDPYVVPLAIQGTLMDGTEFYGKTNLPFTHTL